MPQQINLYNKALRRQRVFLSLTNLVIAAAVLGTLLLFAGATLRYQVAGLNVAIQRSDAALATLRAELTRPSGAEGGSSAADLAEQQQQLAAKRAVLEALHRGGAAREGAGFSAFLSALARRTAPGLWLTGFSVDGGGGGMELRGRMLTADQLPHYIEQLKREPAFQGRQFLRLEMAHGPAAQGRAAGPKFSAFVLSAIAGKRDTAAAEARQ